MYLKKGDTVAIVSPARAIDSEKIQPAIRFFEKHGLQVVLGKYIHNVDHQMAGTDAEKAEDIQEWRADSRSVKVEVYIEVWKWKTSSHREAVGGGCKELEV